MSKIKYKFNPETLTYHLVERSLKSKILRVIYSITSFLFFAIVGAFLYSIFFDSPKEKILKRENKMLVFQYQELEKKLKDIEKILAELQYRDDNIYRSLFEVEPIPESVRKGGIGGAKKYEELENLEHSDLIIHTSKHIDQIMKQIYIQSKSFDEIVYLAKNKEKWLKSMPAILPILIRDKFKITSHFGIRYDPVYRNIKKMHEGIDFNCATGTNVRATGDGTVIEANYSKGGYGNEVIIDHGFGYKTRYAHLSKILVKKGQKVSRGEIIGKVGSTGKSVGPHLHYEVRKNNKPINPINFFYLDLSPEEYDKMIEMSAQEGGIALD
ncbi:MAG: M23 family metallopeptidase [Bacteroidales bacterium]|nr:M23 family metallopeptidase [Bacteroidales bacterium]